MNRGKLLDILGGTRFFSLLILLWIPFMTSIIWSYILKDFQGMQIMAPPTIAGFIAYCVSKTVQHVKLDEKGM